MKENISLFGFTKLCVGYYIDSFSLLRLLMVCLGSATVGTDSSGHTTAVDCSAAIKNQRRLHGPRQIAHSAPGEEDILEDLPGQCHTVDA